MLVLIGGSAMAIDPVWNSGSAPKAEAIVLAGYGGEECGMALANVLFGRYNPAGRL